MTTPAQPDTNADRRAHLDRRAQAAIAEASTLLNWNDASMTARLALSIQEVAFESMLRDLYKYENAITWLEDAILKARQEAVKS